jgi:hypothetical protein
MLLRAAAIGYTGRCRNRMVFKMSYIFQTPSEDASDGRTSTAFRIAASILVAAAVLLTFTLGTDAGLHSAWAWVAAVAGAVAAFFLAHVLIVTIMIVVPPVLIIAVLIRFLAT